MRRKEREVTEKERIKTVLEECMVVRIAVLDQDGLYIVPMNFGYCYDEKLELYVHSAKSGRKVQAFAANPKVAFEMDCAHQLIEGQSPCQYGFHYKSLIGNGSIALLDDEAEKRNALNLLMAHQCQGDVPVTGNIDMVLVYKITVENFTAKAC